MINNIVHMGYSKCLSTTLQDTFSRHPEVSVRVKSGCFGLAHTRRAQEGAYFDSFGPLIKPIRVESDEHLIVPTIDNEWLVNVSDIADVEVIVRQIKSTLREPKIVVVFREQAEMFRSKYCQYIRGGGGAAPSEFYDWICSLSDGLSGYNYNKTADLLFSYFGRENVYFRPLEAAKEGYVDFLAELGRFSGAYGLERHSRIYSNRSPSVNALKAVRLFNRAFVLQKRSYNAAPKTIFPLPWTQQAFRSVVERVDKTVWSMQGDATWLMDDYWRRRIMGIFKESNRDAMRVLGENLDRYGYC